MHRFLNQLCGQAYGAIYQPPRERLAAALRLLPPATSRATLRARGALRRAASAGLFLLGMLLGALVVLLEPRGAELLVPEHLRDYVARKADVDGRHPLGDAARARWRRASPPTTSP